MSYNIQIFIYNVEQTKFNRYPSICFDSEDELCDFYNKLIPTHQIGGFIDKDVEPYFVINNTHMLPIAVRNFNSYYYSIEHNMDLLLNSNIDKYTLQDYHKVTDVLKNLKIKKI